MSMYHFENFGELTATLKQFWPGPHWLTRKLYHLQVRPMRHGAVDSSECRYNPWAGSLVWTVATVLETIYRTLCRTCEHGGLETKKISQKRCSSRLPHNPSRVGTLISHTATHGQNATQLVTSCSHALGTEPRTATESSACSTKDTQKRYDDDKVAGSSRSALHPGDEVRMAPDPGNSTKWSPGVAVHPHSTLHSYVVNSSGQLFHQNSQHLRPSTTVANFITIKHILKSILEMGQ